jgi:hypothetical protein
MKDIAVLDSVEGTNYREKLLSIEEPCWLINYDESMVASGIAVVSSPSLSWVGIYDRSVEYAYLMWASDGSDVEDLLRTDPLRFLMFRLPSMPTVFMPMRALTSKWYRWAKQGDLLLAFNALERRLIGHSNE